ncbi:MULTISPECIES: META domain-containing protein [Oceanimonas]|uniref:META domain-containing protein n=1 Tax=Oceanimonas smirnovii TaxID=264574 RepID=A0ABW7P094_9GAMM|nr:MULTISPECIES: META domain-containing protein [Oceanimonas]MDV2856669.1 META domain-containing protein [Oceanimonas sp. CAM02]
MKLAFAATTALLLTACSGGLKVVESDLQHHHWNLTAVNGEAVGADIKSELEIGEHFSINGQAGCNRFFGSATLKQGVLKAEPLATTQMACSPDAQKVEIAVLNTLNKGATVIQDSQQLILKGEEYTLTYQLADWMK